MIAAWFLGLAFIIASDAATAADTVHLRDGAIVLGQVIEPSPRGRLTLIVRREWAKEHLPDLLKSWEATEATAARPARAQRIRRLEAWKRERIAPANDPILNWIDGELTRLRDDAAEPPRLLQVTIEMRQVKKVERRPRDVARLLRLAWRAKLEEPETRPLELLRQALEGRGMALEGSEAVPLDDLLALSSETEQRWLLRRAATEVSCDEGLRFIHSHGLVLPEGAQPGADTVAAAAGSVLKELMGDGTPSEDPLVARFRAIEEKGGVGAVVTTQELAPDMDRVTVMTTLWVRVGKERWVPAIQRPITVRASNLAPDAGQPLNADPQVQAIFRTFEGLGLGAIPAETKQGVLNIGAATHQALGLARSALEHDIRDVALPVSP